MCTKPFNDIKKEKLAFFVIRWHAAINLFSDMSMSYMTLLQQRAWYNCTVSPATVGVSRLTFSNMPTFATELNCLQLIGALYAIPT
jgi:hypothetical protein